jgi:acylphosphatase
VRNLKDGTVEAVFEGDRERVEAALEWCRQGPRHADVTDVAVTWGDYSGEFSGFNIAFERDG